MAAPKVYGFNTGFVRHYRGVERLHAEDLGLLWGHYVLDEIHAGLQTRAVQYWRDKRGHEVDFVFVGRGKAPIAIECRIGSVNFNEANLAAFRRGHPAGVNLVVAADVTKPFVEKRAGLRAEFVGLDTLIRRLGGTG